MKNNDCLWLDTDSWCKYYSAYCSIELLKKICIKNMDEDAKQNWLKKHSQFQPECF